MRDLVYTQWKHQVTNAQRYGHEKTVRIGSSRERKLVHETGQPRNHQRSGSENSWLKVPKNGLEERKSFKTCPQKTTKCQRQRSKVHDRNNTLLVIIDVVKRRRRQFETDDIIIGVNAPGRVRYIDIHKLYDNAEPVKHMHNNHKKVLRETQGCHS